MKSPLSSITIVLALLTSSLFAQQQKGTAFSSLPVLTTDDQLQFLLPMTVEGKQAHFLLDTGCGYSTVVSLELAKALNKDLEDSEMEGVGGSSKAYEVAFKQFKLGGRYAVQFKKTHVTDLSKMVAAGVKGKEIKPQGLIGSLTLMAIRGVVDTAAGHVLVPPSGADKELYKRSMESRGALIVPLAKKAYARPYIEVKIQDKNYLFLVDTAASTCIIEPSVARDLELKATGTSSPVVGTGDKVIKGAQRTKVKDLMLGGKIKIPSLGFTVLKTKGFKEEGISYGGIIGVPVIKALKAQLDFGSYSMIIPMQ